MKNIDLLDDPKLEGYKQVLFDMTQKQPKFKLIQTWN